MAYIRTPGIPAPGELGLIAPDEAIDPEALVTWVSGGKVSGAEGKGDARRRRHRRRVADALDAEAEARRAARPRTTVDPDDLVVVDDLASIIEDTIIVPEIAGINFGGRGGDDADGGYDYERDYYGRGGSFGSADLDDYFGDAALDVGVDGRPVEGTRGRRGAGGRGLMRVTSTPLASDFGEDDDYAEGDEGYEEEPGYLALFDIPDSDDRPFSVRSLGRDESRRMGTTLQRFLDGNVDLGPQVCALWRSFPCAYGIPTGRQRYAGFAARSTRAVLTGEDFGEVTHMSVARMRSFDRFVRDLADGDPYAIEFLGLEHGDILYMDSTARSILESADSFVSKRCGKSALRVVRDLVARIGRPADQDVAFGTERRLRAMQAVDEVKEGFTEAYGRFATIYVDVQNYMGAPTVMASLSLRDMPISEMEGLSLALSDIAEGYGLMSGARGDSALRGEALAHAMCEAVRIMQVTTELLDGEGLHVFRDRGSHVLEAIVRGRLIGPDGRPLPEYWDIVDEESLRLEDSLELSDLPEEPDMAEIERIIAMRNRKTVLEDA